jgi:hypothetical protein
MDTLIEESQLAAWVWRVGDESMPALPPSKNTIHQTPLENTHDAMVA